MTVHREAHQPVAPSVPTRTSWPVVGLTVLAGVVVALGVGKLIAALPTVSADLGIGLTESGVVLGAFTAVSAVCGVALGTLVDRVGALRTLLGGLLLVAVGSVAGALAATGTHLLVTTAVEGTGYVAVVVAAPTIIARATAAGDGGLALGIWGTYMPAGQAIMAAAAPVLLAAVTWRGTWVVHALLLVACAAAAWWVLRAVPPVPAAGPGRLRRDLGAALRSPAPRLLTLGFGLYVVLFSFTSFLPTIYVAQGLGTATATLLTGAVIVVNALGNLAAGLLLRRGTPHWTLMATAAVVAGLATVGVFAADAPFAATYASALVFAAASGLLPATVLAAVPALVPSAGLVPITNGMVVQAIGIGMVVGPVTYGALADGVGGWHATPLVAGGAALLALLVALRVRRLEHAARSRPS